MADGTCWRWGEAVVFQRRQINNDIPTLRRASYTPTLTRASFLQTFIQTTSLGLLAFDLLITKKPNLPNLSQPPTVSITILVRAINIPRTQRLAFHLKRIPVEVLPLLKRSHNTSLDRSGNFQLRKPSRNPPTPL